ncbi:lysM domain receptor-like kinase 4 [Salvia miltiorrhiza]|uniref:lysM domain receptor-like kinase 4 n=1 Tax=Salvia miltiorrhiza TaxID=226208 RepID=UPI0025AC9F76|nr:lysM domain receptor-like kinase 4 [Salvia miltiorrhiza]
MAQQNYSGAAIYRCNRNEATTPFEYLYACNGQRSSCRAFLIFTAKSPYATAAAIANLSSSDQAEVSRINNVTTFKVLPEGQEVIIPVECSCSGQKYQATTTYRIRSYETYFIIADKTFKGLSTCDALKHANTYQDTSLLPGQVLRVPLRCACPTAEQADAGTKLLLTYPVGHGDTLLGLSKRFNVSVVSIYEANRLLDEFAKIQPFTTILIPLPSEPSHSQAISRRYNATTSPPMPPPVALNSRSNRAPLIVGIAAGSFFLLILLLLVLLFLSHKKRAQVVEGRGGNATSPQDLILEIARFDRALKAYKFSEIRKATRNFRSRSRIKDHEYRGTFKREVLAVKKSSANAEHEVKMLYKINHFNIVRLCGFCQDKDDLYLVYEYMANGSLREWLSRRGPQHMKSWNQRIRIALDVANGLLYLHNFANPAYVHNDVTSSNVLLDGNLRAKIANFSLAREANCSDTKRVMGTKGYMAPECLDAGPVTSKVDVYAFGVVLLELITDELPVFEQDGRGRLLSTTITALMETSNAETDLCRFVASGLTENGGTKYAIQVVKLSLSCLIQDPSDRPDMVEVVSILLKMQSIIHKPL